MSDSIFQSCILCNFEQGGPDPFYHNVQSEYQLGVPLLHQQKLLNDGPPVDWLRNLECRFME